MLEADLPSNHYDKYRLDVVVKDSNGDKKGLAVGGTGRIDVGASNPFIKSRRF